MSVPDVVLVVLLVAAALCLVRALAGPTPADRTVSVDILGILMVGVSAVLSVKTGRDVYIIVALSWSLLAFVGSLALAKRLEGRRFDE